MTSKAVNRPTDVKQKEADVNQKLQFYGIYSAFANGKVPSNKQIDVALNSALESKVLATPSKKLSAGGQQLVADLRDVIEKAKLLLLTKNDGNLLQDFIWQTQQIDLSGTQRPDAPVEKDIARQHGNEALEGLRTLGTLMLSNGQFRKLLNDATILLRDIAGDAAQNAASRVSPSEDQLGQIDHAAEENTWHDVPDLSKDGLRQQWADRKPFGKKDAKEAAGDATAAAHPEGSRDPADAAVAVANDQQQGTASGVDAQAGAQTGVDNFKNRVDPETRDQTRELRERTQNYMKTKMPKERREQTIWRLKKMVIEIQGHQDYQRAVETLLSLAEQYTGHSKTFAQSSGGTVKGARTDEVQKAEADLKTLLERFANSTSTDDLFDSINTIYRDADADPELREWFKNIDTYIRRCLQTQGYVMEDDANEEWNRLYDRGNYLLREKYRSHTDRILDEFKFFGQQFDEDPQNKAFGLATQKLFTDLGNDENGKPTFKPHLVKDLTEVILPELFESIRYVPIPRIEASDPTVDVVVENLVVESDNLAPNVFEFGSDNYFRWGRKGIQNKNKNKIMISVSGVQMDLRDVSYYIKKKQGFPSLTDKGVMDIFMGGQGFSFKVEMETADQKDQHHFFKVNKVTVDIKNLDIKLKQSSHKLLFALAKPLLLKVMRPALQKIIEAQIKEQVRRVDSLTYDIRQEANRAADEARRNPDPDNVQNIYQRYWTAAQKQFLEGKDKGQAKVQDKKVNVAMTQHDSIFKNIQLPGGISTKATEYKELAAKGDRWESPVFSIGAATESTNLPKLNPVQRKRHNVATGTAGVNGAVNGTPGTATTAQTTTTTGFSNQVDQAFDTANGRAKDGQHTTLGTQNPVLTGSA
ncbi:MAG: hypothetical protein M1821_000107 [Bathelium mastoideum]|nr:MAG: hypothetical protein M1821_000107 [Bathelium mastoideum]